MIRNIHIANAKGRNAEVQFQNSPPSRNVHYVTDGGTPARNRKIVRGTAETSIAALEAKYGDLDALAEALIAEDPELDIEAYGEFIVGATRIFVDPEMKPVYRISQKEFVYDPGGELKDERDVKELLANINIEEPLKWSGKWFKKKDIFSKFIFGRKYQIIHTNGLSYDYLYDMAKELQEKESMMLIGSGAKGMGPLIFQDGGKPFRAFLEGRIEGDKYLLLMHLSNLELKALPEDA